MVFSSNTEAFKTIARHEGLPQDEQTLFGLAVDSTVERVGTSRHGVFSIVRPQYYDDRKHRFGIRGAQGQGRYYVFQRNGSEWRLVGVLDGSSYELRSGGDKFSIITGWHMSASESPKIVYSWNGRTFEQEAPK
ncbi:MAG TPA: hypothetical protein VMZ92_04240 [Planctomycetota bacterium]|nr:hypothetical protein [Planctomycetota bacterium]